MEIMERYIYAVTKRLPKTQREETEKELRQRIEKMLSEKNGDLESVLKELGDPVQVANEYRGFKQYLIGPEYYETYLLIIKIVVAVLLVVMAIGKFFELISNPGTNIFQSMGELVGAVFGGILQSFAIITIIFALNERFAKVKIDLKEWSPKDLPEIPEKKYRIKPAEPLFSIFFNVLFTLIFVFNNHWIGVYHFDQGELISVVPIFSATGIQQLLPYILGLTVLSILKDGVKFLVGKWTVFLGVLIGIVNMISILLAIVIFTNPVLWNPNFVTELYATGIVTGDIMDLLERNWVLLTNGFIYIFVFGYIVDTISSLVKGFKNKR